VLFFVLDSPPSNHRFDSPQKHNAIFDNVSNVEETSTITWEVSKVADQLEQLKSKYATALRVLEQLGIRLQNLHVQDNKLFVRGEAPSQDAKNKFWNQVKLIDPSYADLTADITVSAAAQAASAAAPKATTYTVQKGDTLSKISKQVYGDAGQYMKIFSANRDQLSDPDKIQVGQVLKIPAA
jgi:LysM repeat protein